MPFQFGNMSKEMCFPERYVCPLAGGTTPFLFGFKPSPPSLALRPGSHSAVEKIACLAITRCLLCGNTVRKEALRQVGPMDHCRSMGYSVSFWVLHGLFGQSVPVPAFASPKCGRGAIKNKNIKIKREREGGVLGSALVRNGACVACHTIQASAILAHTYHPRKNTTKEEQKTRQGNML